MAISTYKMNSASTIAALNALLAIEIAASRMPFGQVLIERVQEYPARFKFSMASATGGVAVSAFNVVEADSPAELAVAITTEIAASRLPVGDPITINTSNGDGLTKNKQKYFQSTATAA